jgi:hypothetical protein
VAYKPVEFSYKHLEMQGFKVELARKIAVMQEIKISAQRWEIKKIETLSGLLP